MRVETAFDPARNLIIVEGEISGPLGETPLRRVLDTGAAESLVVPDIVDALGYSPRDAEVVTGVYSAVGKEQGYILRVGRFSALGFTLPDVRIHVFDLADRYGIDGLLGPDPRREDRTLTRGKSLPRRFRSALSRIARVTPGIEIAIAGIGNRLHGHDVTLRPMSKRKVASPKDLTPAQKMLAKLRKQAAARLLKRRRAKSGQ